MKITVIRKQPTKEKLKAIYDLCNQIYKDDKYYYSSDEVKKLKTVSKNIFL